MSGGRASGVARGRFALLVVAVVTIAALPSAAASTRRPHAASSAVRLWHGMWIQSLDAPAAATPRAAATGSRSSSTRTHTDQRLSNERSFTRWAYVTRIATIYRRPTSSSHQVSRLHWYTEDGFDEIYLLLRTHWDTHGQEWVELRVPARPNGQVGWVRRGALGAFHLTHTLVVVNRSRVRMYFYYNGRKIWSAPVGVGQPGTPTPAGHFWIRERFKLLDPSNGYYPYAF